MNWLCWPTGHLIPTCSLYIRHPPQSSLGFACPEQPCGNELIDFVSHHRIGHMARRSCWVRAHFLEARFHLWACWFVCVWLHGRSHVTIMTLSKITCMLLEVLTTGSLRMPRISGSSMACDGCFHKNKYKMKWFHTTILRLAYSYQHSSRPQCKFDKVLAKHGFIYIFALVQITTAN